MSIQYLEVISRNEILTYHYKRNKIIRVGSDTRIRRTSTCCNILVIECYYNYTATIVQLPRSIVAVRSPRTTLNNAEVLYDTYGSRLLVQSPENFRQKSPRSYTRTEEKLLLQLSLVCPGDKFGNFNQRRQVR